MMSEKHRKNLIKLVCPQCGIVFFRAPCFVKNAKISFCSIACSRPYMAKLKAKRTTCKICENELKVGEGYAGPSNRTWVCDACKAKMAKENMAQAAIKKLAREMRRRAKARQCGICGKSSTRKYCHECKSEKADEIRKKENKESHKKCMSDARLHLAMVFRVAMGQCLRGEKKRRKTFDILGYTVEELKCHLERQFKPGMTWENYGTHWHVDHIIPVSAFNIQSIASPDLVRAWSLKNLQPLEAKENIRKGKKLEKPFQPSLCV